MLLFRDAAPDMCWQMFDPLKCVSLEKVVDLNMAKSKSAAATGKGATRWPKIQQKHGVSAEELHGQNIMQASSASPAEQTAEVLPLSEPLLHYLICVQVQSCLSVAEAGRFVETAESIGFQHQSSRGAAYVEVSMHSSDHRQPRYKTCLSTSQTEQGKQFFIGSSSYCRHQQELLHCMKTLEHGLVLPGYVGSLQFPPFAKQPLTPP